MSKHEAPRRRRESPVERQIREAMERGEFDNLSGAGKPLPNIDEPHDDMWWIKDKLRRENISLLPPALALRKEVEDALAQIAKADGEAAVRRIVTAINARIAHVNARITSGPASTTMPLPVDRIIQEWRTRRQS